MKTTNAALERIELAKWCKRMEIYALDEQENDAAVSESDFDFLFGLAEAYAAVWARIVFDGVHPSESEYQQADAAWADMVKDDE